MGSIWPSPCVFSKVCFLKKVKLCFLSLPKYLLKIVKLFWGNEEFLLQCELFYLTYFFFWHCLVIRKLMTSACNRWFQDCSTFSLLYKGFSTIAIGFIVIALVIFGIWRCEGSNWNLSQKKATFKKLVLLRLRKQDILLDKKLMSFLPIWVFLKKSYFHIANNLKKTGLIKGNCMCVSVCVFVCGGRGGGRGGGGNLIFLYISGKTNLILI